MNPIDCLNKACKNLIKHKGLQIIVESVNIEAEPSNLLGGGKVSFSNMPMEQKTNFNVTIRLLHNFTIDLVFSEDDFDPAKPWKIEKDLKLDGLGDDDKQVARFMYFFWVLSKCLKTPKADSGPVEEFIFTRTKTIRQTL